MDALDRLIERYGSGAILSVGPYIPEGGAILRWVVEIDGADDPDVDVFLRDDGELRVLGVTIEAEEFELLRWNPSDPTTAVKEPARMVWSLGQTRGAVDRNRQ